MVAVVKPDLENIWANQGGSTAPSAGQIASGWVQNQFPPSEVTNWLQNRVENSVKYLYQVGIGTWDAKTEFRVGSLTIAADGNLYKSKSANINKNPLNFPADWEIPFEKYGTSVPLQNALNQILTVDGHLSFYVRKNAPIMNAKAIAPAYEADIGLTNGFRFKGTTSTSITSVGNEIVFTADGISNGRIKKDKPTLAMNDNTLVTTELLKKVIDEVEARLTKRLEIPVGYSLVTNNAKPPSDPAQLGYGTWVLDVQGRALVGVSKDTAGSTPEWVKDPNSLYGEYDHKMTLDELVGHSHLMDGRWKDGGSGGVQGGDASDPNIYQTKETGGSKPFNVCQPSQTKYIWTRTG